MKTFNDPPDGNSFRNKEEVSRYQKLQGCAKIINMFEYNDTLFKGNYNLAIQKFIYNNPQKSDFFVWLQDNYYIFQKIDK